VKKEGRREQITESILSGKKKKGKGPVTTFYSPFILCEGKRGREKIKVFSLLLSYGAGEKRERKKDRRLTLIELLSSLQKKWVWRKGQ